MTLMDTDPSVVGVDGDGLRALGEQVNDALSTTHGADPELHALVLAAVDSFVHHGPDPTSAVRPVVARCQQLGAHHALRGRRPEELEACFGAVHGAIQQHLGDAVVVADLDTLTSLREQATDYLQHIMLHARQGLDHVQRMRDLDPAVRTDLLREVFFNGRRVALLAMLLHLCERPQLGTARPVAALGTTQLPAALRDDPAVVVSRQPNEAVVPGDWTVDDIERLAGAPVVVGPTVELDQVHEAVRLTRAAAQVAAPGHSVETEDVLGTLLVASSPLLTELLVRKHLSPLQDMPLERRIGFAETLLQWLESGQPVNVVARSLGLATQTAHSRMVSARKLFGDLLTDPDGRLELILALRTAIPQWRGSAA